ncbi:hypothetical protein B0H17DRAFT_1215664 [Mycena rosella]|uniref:Uncharacterized protein n=1 Tax=Mycena rosella TaxID=1033263 RepID=A0AAD7CHD6_MYCRO|nr:hypothetical protein B0H17DRAFT_1215664 [Mycena rosella]
MAVPATYTTLDLSGKFTMMRSASPPDRARRKNINPTYVSTQNKTLTDQSALDGVLKLQGVGMFKRMVAGLASSTMCIRHFTDAAGVEQLEIEQGVSGGPAPKPEARPLTWTEKTGTSESPFLGTVVGRTRRVKAGELGDEFLESGWTAETLEHGPIEAEMRGGDTKWCSSRPGASR